MATAALLKIDPRLAANIRAYIAQILGDPNADDRLRASLIKEAMLKYNVSIQTISDATGYTLEVINQYLSHSIDPSEVISFAWRDGSMQNVSLLNFAKVRRQLQNEKQKLKLTYQGNLDDPTLTDQVALQLVYLGIEDILDFGKKERITGYAEDGSAQTAVDFVNTKTGKLLQSTDDYKDNIYNYAAFGNQKCWSFINGGAGGNYTMACVDFTNTDLPVFYTQLGKIDRGRGQTGIFQQIYSGFVVPLAPAILMVAGAYGIASVIGDAVLGSSIAADYPLISKSIGQVAVNVAITGGDVAHSVTGAAKGLIGSNVGDVVGTGMDSVAVGQASAAAVNAALSGGNVNNAVAKTLIYSQGKNVDDTTNDYLFPTNSTTVDYNQYDFSAPATTTDASGNIVLAPADLNLTPTNLVDLNQTIDASSVIQEDMSAGLTPDASGTIYDPQGEFTSMPMDVYLNSIWISDEGDVMTPANQVVMTHDEVVQTANENPDQPEKAIAAKVQEKLNAAQGATVASAVAKGGRPADMPPPAPQTKVPSIVDQLKTADQVATLGAKIWNTTKQVVTGKYSPNYATSPYGMPRVQQVGVPVQQPDGSIITNNGNGTQTIRYQNGTMKTVSTGYSTTGAGILGGIGGISTNTLLIGGAVLVGALLISRR
jgi:hypothetical protein